MHKSTVCPTIILSENVKIVRVAGGVLLGSTQWVLLQGWSLGKHNMPRLAVLRSHKLALDILAKKTPQKANIVYKTFMPDHLRLKVSQIRTIWLY